MAGCGVLGAQGGRGEGISLGSATTDHPPSVCGNRSVRCARGSGLAGIRRTADACSAVRHHGEAGAFGRQVRDRVGGFWSLRGGCRLRPFPVGLVNRLDVPGRHHPGRLLWPLRDSGMSEAAGHAAGAAHQDPLSSPDLVTLRRAWRARLGALGEDDARFPAGRGAEAGPPAGRDGRRGSCPAAKSAGGDWAGRPLERKKGGPRGRPRRSFGVRAGVRGSKGRPDRPGRGIHRPSAGPGPIPSRSPRPAPPCGWSAPAAQNGLCAGGSTGSAPGSAGRTCSGERRCGSERRGT
ncbi:hypothetical protein SAMN02745673_00874 [Marinactinospora thermotolerans DSM 45154]|uniref:Uncharacterized protein n=1 Tax=Marinactinospora thermotolerans DSM 45154 TaxID=1122192 RepID=A0A1T4LYT3_9ACTN|nr:hypothetical protein SAMN02745673_00874 [Marinactinospora thermotolerans DSM 45154]